MSRRACYPDPHGCQATGWFASLLRRAEIEMLDMEDHLGKQRRDVIIMQRIQDLASLSLSHHQPHLTQHPQLMRHRRLRHADRIDQLPDAPRAAPQAAKDLNPARDRESLHDTRHPTSEDTRHLDPARMHPTTVTHKTSLPASAQPTGPENTERERRIRACCFAREERSLELRG